MPSLGNIVKDSNNQLRMKEQVKGYKAGVALKQHKKNEHYQFVLQYRGNISLEYVKKLNKIHPAETIFTNRKLKSCLPSFNSSFDKDLTCTGCKSIYVEQTC